MSRSSRTRSQTKAPRLWIVRDRPPPEPASDPSPAAGPEDVKAILDEGERGALRIAKLSTELAEVTAEVVRCRGEVIVARR
ncbi:MAG: hypothetical protein ACXWEA_05220, partial [Solirubrobacterales bacterium]